MLFPLLKFFSSLSLLLLVVYCFAYGQNMKTLPKNTVLCKNLCHCIKFHFSQSYTYTVRKNHFVFINKENKNLKLQQSLKNKSNNLWASMCVCLSVLSLITPKKYIKMTIITLTIDRAADRTASLAARSEASRSAHKKPRYLVQITIATNWAV